MIAADKNMGVVLMLRDQYIKQCIDEHLRNTDVYQDITPIIGPKQQHLEYKYHAFVSKHAKSGALTDYFLKYLNRNYRRCRHKVARFRATAKVHKNPVKLCPIVAKVGTTIEGVSKWLDYKLQKLMELLPWCCKDSQSFRDEVIKLQIPPNARLVTFDAKSMYSNIDIDHALQIMKLWLDSIVPEHYDLHPEAILDALELVMRWNIMQFGDSYFLQLIGTAMGTSVAVVLANLYFGWHEKEVILPKYRDNLKRIFFHSRFIDDVWFIWIGPQDEEWEQLLRDYDDFGILRWDFNDPAPQVDFLDLTLRIENNKIITKTFQKKNNPYLYLPAHSAHAPGMIKGLVYGLLRRYYYQNSKYSDFTHFSNLLFNRLLARGWDRAVLSPIFSKSLEKIKASPKLPPSPKGDASFEERLFFHLQFHPEDIPRSDIRKFYSEELEEVVKKEIGIDLFTIAYSRATNIGDVISKAKLYEVSGKEVSKFITGEQA